VRSVAGDIYDLLGYVHPALSVPHNGMKFSSTDMDYDTSLTYNCAALDGGSWWINTCGLFLPTRVVPDWFGLASASFHLMKNIHMMVKLQ